MYIKISAEGYGPELGRETLHVYAADSDLSRRAMFDFAVQWFSQLENETPFVDWSPAILSRAAPSYFVTKDTRRGDPPDTPATPVKDPRLVEELMERLFGVLFEEKRNLRYSQLPDPDREALKTAVHAFLIDLERKGIIA